MSETVYAADRKLLPDLLEFSRREEGDSRRARVFATLVEFFELLVRDKFSTRDADARDGSHVSELAFAVGDKIKNLFRCVIAISGTLQDDQRRQEFLGRVRIGEVDGGRRSRSAPDFRRVHETP